MRLSLVAAVLVYLMTMTDLAFGGLVEVNSSQYLRESGNPQAQYLEVTLDNAGEIRVSNVNLQDGYIELAASTDVLLNGSSLMQPFSLPTGGSAVFPLEAGTHYLEVTLRGKPGGGLKVSFYEDKPDAPVQGKGWELLDDGTVLHRKTGLIWHRNLSSPGWGRGGEASDSPAGSCHFIRGCRKEDEYIAKLNAGVYGVDSIYGNSGFNDWRIPTAEELISAVDYRAFPPLTDADGNVGEGIPYDPERGINFFQGMVPGEPLLFSVDSNGAESPYGIDQELLVYSLISSTADPRNGDYRKGEVSDFDYPCTWTIEFLSFDQEFLWCSPYAGDVWPVRGGTPE